MILENKFYSQFVNGENFTDNLTDFTTILTGSIGDKIQKITKFSYSKKSVASAPFEFVVNGNTITFNGDFVADGFRENDIIDLYDDLGTSFIFQDREIFIISANQIIFNGAPVVGPVTVTDGRMIMKTEMKSFKHRFGLIGLNEPINYVSKVDGIAENIYLADGVGLDSGGGRSTVPVAMNPVNGVKSWQTDETATVAYVSTGSLAEDFEQVFEVIHTFRILPFYLDGQLPNIQTKVKPALFIGVDTIKYVSETVLAEQSFLLDGTRKIELDTLNGSVGWFDENKNGFAPEYLLLATSYKDSATNANVLGLQTTKKTKVTTTVESANLLFVDGNHSVQLAVAHSVSDYEQNNKTIEENFIYENLFKLVSDPAKSGGSITNFTTNVITPQYLEINFEYEFTAQQAIDAAGLNSLIFITVADEAPTNSSTDRVALISDTSVNLSNTDVAGLVFMNNMLFHPQDSNLAGPSFNNIDGWLEDGFIAEFDFDLNADLSARVGRLELKLAVYNNSTGDYFTLQTIPYNIASATIIGGMQYWNQQATTDVVNFILPKSSDWKKKQLITNGPAVNGGVNVINHSLICGIRLNYESWISLPGADTFFYDTSLPNNGLNLDSSRFDDSPFEVVVIMESDVEDNSKTVTNYSFISQPFGVETYSEDGNVPAGWTGVVELYDENLNSIDVIQSNNNTIVKVVFTKDVAAPVITDLWARIRMYQVNTTIYDAFEIGTYEDPEAILNPLLPAIGQTRLKTTNGGTTIELEALIDGSKIIDGENWVVTGRIGEKSAELVYSAGITATFIGGSSGLWDFDFSFSELGGASLINKQVRFKVFNDDNNDLLADVIYRYGDFPQVDAPLFDNIGNWATAVQPFIQAGTQFIDGGSGGFTKLDWANASKNIADSFFKTAKNLRVELALSTSPFANDLMDVQNQPIGNLTVGYQGAYSTVNGKFYIPLSIDPLNNEIEPAIIEVENGVSKIYSSGITPDFLDMDVTAYSTLNTSCSIDEINLYNGKPVIYATFSWPFNPIGNFNYRFEFHRLYWNGIDGYDNVLLYSTKNAGIASGVRKIYNFKNYSKNSRPIFMTSQLWYSPNYTARRDFWKLLYYDGSEWQYNNWDSLMLESGGSGNPNDDNWAGVMDNFGRFFYHRRREFSASTSRIDMITYNGSGDVVDSANWTRQFMAGSQTAQGFVDGLGGVARLGGFITDFNIIGYDVNTFPIIQFYDRTNQSLRQLDYDFIAGQMFVTTIATVGVTAGHDNICDSMFWTGSEYFCSRNNFGYFTMDTAGVQTLIEVGSNNKDLGVKY